MYQVLYTYQELENSWSSCYIKATLQLQGQSRHTFKQRSLCIQGRKNNKCKNPKTEQGLVYSKNSKKARKEREKGSKRGQRGTRSTWQGLQTVLCNGEPRRTGSRGVAGPDSHQEPLWKQEACGDQSLGRKSRGKGTNQDAISWRKRWQWVGWGW